jgi:hypothetical protein
MKLHVATFNLSGLSIKFIILIGIVGAILIILMEKLEVPTEMNLCQTKKALFYFFKTI